MIKIGQNEILRKILHIFSSIIPIVYFFFIEGKKTMLFYLSIAIFIAFIIEISRIRLPNFQIIFIRCFGSMLRKKEINGGITGATWMLVSWYTTIFLFPVDIAVAAMIFLSIGDAIAALVGKSFPIYKIKNKSVSGTLAGIIMCVISVVFINSSLPLLVIIIGATSAMIIEILPIPINDNLTIPNFSGIAMMLAEYIL